MIDCGEMVKGYCSSSLSMSGLMAAKGQFTDHLQATIK